MSIVYIIAAIAMFGVMITVHEAGHFFAARLSRIPVREFAIGFGPKLLGWKSKKHETTFSLRAIPMGGYCAFYGEDDGSEDAKKDPRSFANHGAWKRVLTILAGPAMNLVLAFLVAVTFFLLSGVPRVTGPATTSVQSVNINSPAEQAGIQPLDTLLSLNGVQITDNISQLIDSASRAGQLPLALVVERPGAGQVTLQVTPLLSQETGQYLIGVSLLINTPQEWLRGSLGQTIDAAYGMCVDAGSAIMSALKNLLLRGQGLNDMTGFVGITQTIVQATQAQQLQGFLYLMCLISINLGLFNLLPIPGLDGSRILFLLLEVIRGKPFKREGYVHAIGMLLLFAFMIWINLRDIIRLF
ncbi:MAG: RIP metalloprotease [Christensenellales bacterium]